ncbi:MAG: FlgO family outer membrane protein [Bacteroidota bacterium]|nr:FlgO family outer membrane protein [Bacteroidota bacterium]
MIGNNISHYRILEKLGEGGMGVVYKAEDTKLKRTVALKFLPKEFLCDSEAKSRFVHEAQAASALNHPNITTIHEIDEVGGKCFISMEYIEGKSIKELAKEKELPIEEILRIAIQTAEGLSKAHQKDIVHRDVKSDNIRITQDGLVKIMDFGLAKLKGASKLTKTGSTLGTLQYMSPEQTRGEDVDQRSDIFSFGVVLYEMVTGQLPFKGEHEAAVVYSIVNEIPEPLARYKANVPEGLQRIVGKALQKDRSIRYQSAADVIADLKGLQKETTGVSVIKLKRKLVRFAVPVSVVFILVVIFLIFKPFGLDTGADKEAIARENTLAVMYFENMVDREDKERLGEIVTNLLITDLSESEYMRVVSSQRLYDILKLLGREGEKKIDRETATQIATKAKASWMLLGTILQVEPQIILTSQLVDVGSGKVAASQRITGETGEKIFSMVDKLTVEVKKDLSLPAVAQKEPDPSVADITTHSPQAYRCYVEGIDYESKLYWKEAEESFKNALKFDSTFAMAYLRLSGYYGDAEYKKMVARAVEYSDKVSQKEKYYIKAEEASAFRGTSEHVEELQKIVKRYPEEKEAFWIIGTYYKSRGQYVQAVQSLNKAIEIDPLYKHAYNELAYLYNEIGDFEKSIGAINKYISIAPDEANPYDTRADIYANNGKIDQAIESYKKACEVKAGFSSINLGHIYLLKREYEKARSYYESAISNGDKIDRINGRSGLALIPLYQGKFKEALKVLDDGIAAERMEGTESFAWEKHNLKAIIFEEKKDLSSALKEVQNCIEINPGALVHYRSYYIELLSEDGNFEKAEKMASTLRKDIEERDTSLMHSYWRALGHIEFSKGNLTASIANFQRAVRSDRHLAYRSFVRVVLARAYLESNMLGEAVAELEKFLSVYDHSRAFSAIAAVKSYYLLGLAYEKSGWNNKAIEKYEEFLDIWKNADPGIEEVEDAKERLKKLKALKH